MRFHRLISRGFGCLPEGAEWDFAPEGLTLLLGNNEVGKSTLVTALLAGLYGEPDRLRGEAKAFRERFAPWQTVEKGPRLSLEVSTEAHGALTVHRDFGAKTQAVRVVDAHARLDRTSEFVQGKKALRVGETLTGLSRYSFIKSVLLEQGELRDFEETGDLVAAIEQVVDSGEAGVTAQDALQRLEEALHQANPLDGKRLLIATILSRMEKAMDDLRQEEQALKADYHAYQAAFQQSDALLQRIQEQDTAIEQAQTWVTQAEYREAQLVLEKQRQLQASITAIELEIERLSPYETFPVAHQPELQARYGEYQHLQSRLQVHEAALRELTAELMAQQEALQAFPWVAEARDLTGLQTRLQQVRDAKQAYDTAEADYRRLSQSLEGKGMEACRFQTLLERFQTVPEERLQAVYRVLMEQRALEAQRAQQGARLDEQQRALETQRQSANAMMRRAVLLGGLGLLLVGSLWGPWPYLILRMVLGGILLLLGAVVTVLGSKYKAATVAMHSAWEAVRQETIGLEARQQELTMQFEALGSAWPDGAFEEDAITWFMAQKQGDLAPLAQAWQAMMFRYTDLAQAISLLGAILPLSQAVLLGHTIDKTALDAWWDEGRRFVEHMDALNAGKHRLETRQQARQDDEQLRRHLEDTLRAMLHASLPEPFETLEVGMACYAEGVTAYHQLQRQRALLDEKRQNLIPPENLAQWEAILHRGGPALDTVSPETPSSDDARQAWRQLTQEREALKDAWAGLQQLIREKQDRFNRRFPVVQAELQDTQALCTRYRAFQQALDVARTVLQSVSEDDYRQWSLRLNARVNAYLADFQSPYRDMRFTTTLAFSLLDAQHREHHQNASFQHLSRGARDQIYLAIRLAMADYFSQQTGHLPLILDDPFVNLDDERFGHAVETLAKASAAGQQILVFSCHAQRYRDVAQHLSLDYPGTIHVHHVSSRQSNSEKVVLSGDF